MTNETIVDARKRVLTRYEDVLDTRLRIERTDEPEETRRFRAILEAAEPPLVDLHVGDVIGWGRTAARARRRAVDKVANRRRGVPRDEYEAAGVTFRTGPAPAPAAGETEHAFAAVVTFVDASSPLASRVDVGTVLAQSRNASNAADRAIYLLGQWAEQARLAEMQRRIMGLRRRRRPAGEAADKSEPARWDDGAPCHNEDPEKFFPEPGFNAAGGQTAAISVCEACPVRAECLARALDRREAFGVWGGTTEATRRKLLRQLGPNAGDVVRARGVIVLALVGGKAAASVPASAPDVPQGDEQAAA